MPERPRWRLKPGDKVRPLVTDIVGGALWRGLTVVSDKPTRIPLRAIGKVIEIRGVDPEHEDAAVLIDFSWIRLYHKDGRSTSRHFSCLAEVNHERWVARV